MAEPEPPALPTASSVAARRAWFVAAGGSVVAGAVAATVLPSAVQPLRLVTAIVVAALFLLSESVTMHVEFRRQTYSWSLNELALTIGLVELGGFWATMAAVVGLGGLMAVQKYPPPKFVFNCAVALLHGSVAVAVLHLLPAAAFTDPLRWFELILAILVSDLVGAFMVTVAIISTAGYPGSQIWHEQLVPIAIVSPVVVSVGIVALLLSSLSAWGWVLILPGLTVVGLLFRRFGKVTREGNSVERVYDFARRVEQVSPDDAGTLQIVEAVRELLNAERVALWLPPYLDEEPRLVVSAENGAVWYDGPGDPDDVFRRRAVAATAGPVLVSAARADEEEAAALARRGVSDLLGASIMTAAGEPGYLEVCDRRSDVVSFADSDRAALDSMLTHVNAAIRQQQLLTQIRYDADHDRLTGLPNRQRLASEIEQLLASEPLTARAGLILAALGNYTEVTDTLGHAASDELLLVTAGLLREHAPPQALLARMEGDQFAVLLPGLSLAATERAARRLREAAATRVRVAQLDLEVTLTLGVAAAPVHGTDAGMLMQRADVALLAAPDSGGVASYHPVLDQQSLRRLQLGTELEQAMADGQISVVFQPIIEAKSSEIVSVETLVRWAHPRYGSIPP